MSIYVYFVMFMCVDVMVVSSTYVVSFTGAGVFDVYMFNSVGDRKLSCGT